MRTQLAQLTTITLRVLLAMVAGSATVVGQESVCVDIPDNRLGFPSLDGAFRSVEREITTKIPGPRFSRYWTLGVYGCARATTPPAVLAVPGWRRPTGRPPW